MRQLVFLCFILLFNCHNAQNTGEIKIQQIPLEKQITYMIDITTSTPVIVYVNDIRFDSKSKTTTIDED